MSVGMVWYASLIITRRRPIIHNFGPEEGQTNSDLCTAAAREALRCANLEPKDLVRRATTQPSPERVRVLTSDSDTELIASSSSITKNNV